MVWTGVLGDGVAEPTAPLELLLAGTLEALEPLEPLEVLELTVAPLPDEPVEELLLDIARLLKASKDLLLPGALRTSQ